MKKHVFKVVLIAILLCGLLCSCQTSDTIRTVDSLLTPPFFYTEYEGLVESFNSEVGSNVILCSPIEGDHLSAITVADLNGDGTEEGIIFYREALESEIAKLAIFTNSANTWKKCGIYTGYGNEIKNLEFTDFDGDGCSDILVTWNYSGISGGSVFSIYKSDLAGINFREEIFESCDFVKVLDMDGDSLNELFFLSTLFDNNASTKSAELFKYKDGSFKEISSAPVDPFSGSYISYKTESSDGKTTDTIYIDGVKSNNVFITEAVRWNKSTGSLESLLYDEESGTNTASVRYEQIKCADINGDGLIEIPIQTAFEDTATNTEESNAALQNDVKLYVTEWTRFESGKEPELVERSFVNISDGYVVNLDLLSFDEAFVRKQYGEDWTSWSVYIESEDNPLGNTIFTIVNIPKSRWESEISKSDFNYITILKNENNVICVKINDFGNESGLKESTVKKIVTELPE